MNKFQKLIDEKKHIAQYMVDEIKYICTKLPKRDPGSEGEKLACEYMADVLKKDCGCQTSYVESFPLHPNAFFGWIYLTVSCAILEYILYFIYPFIGVLLMSIGWVILVLQFGLYKQIVDFLFKKKIGHNVTAIKKCTSDVRARVFFNGHPDAAWVSTFNEKFGGKGYMTILILGMVGALIQYILTIIRTAQVGVTYSILNPSVNPVMFWLQIATLLIMPFTISLYFMWDERRIVDGANDNLSGCYMGIGILKAMEEQGVLLEHTEVGVILSGCEEAGLRGAKAWTKKHKNDFNDVPTYIYSYDTIHDGKFLMPNYRDLNSTVEGSKFLGDTFYESAQELGIHCDKGAVPPFGGATDSAAFSQAGFQSVGITALNHVLEDYYHTKRDTYDNMNEDCLADCYAVSVECLRKIDASVADKSSDDVVA